MRYSIVFMAFCLISTISGYSQNTLSGVIVDEKTKSPLVGVTIVDSNTGKGTISEENGKFSILIGGFPIVLTFRHIGYFEDSLRIESSDQFKKYYQDKTLSVSLRINPFKLDEVVVSTPGIAIKLFGNEPYSIIDYVVKDNRFIALGYRNYNNFKSEIFLGKLSGKVILATPLRSFEEIYQDCQGEVYAVTRDQAFLTKIKNDSIEVEPICNSQFFEEKVKPIRALDDQFFIFVSKSPQSQYHDYYVCDAETNRQELFYRVGDEKRERTVNRIDNQVRREFVGKISRGFISSGMMRIINSRIDSLQYKMHTEYKPMQSSMFQVEDSVLLFDFDYQAVHCFTLGAELLWRTDIQVELNQDFTGRVHYDQITNKFFLEFLNVQLSYLIEIDPLTGMEVQTIPIKRFKHIDHISVHDNRIFFLHQPDFGDRGKKIYFLDI